VPVFEYKGKTLAGATVAGEMQAKDRQDLERVLRSRRILVSQVNKKAAEIKLSFGRKKVAKVDISRFTRQFATMIGAGLPMVQCLEILSAQAERPEMKRIINEVRESVSSGTTLSEALSKHRKVFDELYTNMVEAGEIGGALDTILVRLANYREKADALVRKVKGAMVYPSVVVIVAVGGACEITPHLGIAEAILDLTSSGETLRSNRLRIIGTVLSTSTVLISHPGVKEARAEKVEEIVLALQSVIHARGQCYLMMNARRECLEEIRKVLPGLSGPTIMEVASREDLVAVHAVVSEERVYGLISRLKRAGARDILVMPIERMIR